MLVNLSHARRRPSLHRTEFPTCHLLDNGTIIIRTCAAAAATPIFIFTGGDRSGWALLNFHFEETLIHFRVSELQITW